jgi:DNA-binding IclR family transcriptional regulator
MKATKTQKISAGAEQNADSVTPMKSLRSALRLLTEFMGEQRDYGVGELAEACQLSKSQVSKVLDAFAEFGLLSQDPESRRYSVGVRSHVLGSRFVTYDPLCRAAMPLMRQLVEVTEQSARLSVFDNDHALYLLGMEGALLSETGWHVGTWLPPHATTAGRVLLAFMPPEISKRLLARPLKKLSERGLSDRKVIEASLAITRETGYSSQRDEIVSGLGTISVPVFGSNAAVIGALGIAFPGHMISAQEDASYVETLHDAARTLSHRMGCAAYPFGNPVGKFRSASGRTPGKPARAAAQR